MKLRPELAALALAASCSGSASDLGDLSDPPPVSGATVTAATQDRGFDPAGHTLVVRFDEDVLQADAEDTSHYFVHGAFTQSAVQTAGDTVRVTFDRLVLPGDGTLTVVPGIRAVSGAVSPGTTAHPIDSTDTDRPDATRIAGVSVVGANNDQVVVSFDDSMVASEVEDLANWSVEAPLGTPFDITGSTIAYDAPTRTATLVLDAGGNLPTHESVAAIFRTMRDIGGNEITTTAFGVSAVNATVTGDTTPPSLVSVAVGATPGTLRFVFDEPVQFVETADLVANTPIVGTRLAFSPASAPATSHEASLGTVIVDGLGTEATFAAAPAAGDTASVYGVADLAGNVMPPVTGVPIVALDTTAPELSIGNSSLLAVEGENNDVIVVTFDRPMHPEGLLDDYRYGILYGFFIDMFGADRAWNGTDQVTWNLVGDLDHDVQVGAAYTVAVTNLMNAQGVRLTGVAQDPVVVAGGDTTAPSLQSARLHPTEPRVVVVTFSEAMHETRVVGPSNYSIAGNTVESIAALGPRGVAVTFAIQPGVGELLEVASAARMDRAGNVSAGVAQTALLSAEAVAPSVVSATATAVAGDANDVLELVFDEQLELSSALDASNYTAAVGGNPLDLSDAELRYASPTGTVRIRLGPGEHLTAGGTVTVTPSVVVDFSGNAVGSAPTPIAIGGDSTPPSSATGFVNFRADPAGATVDVLVDEALDAGASLTVSWSASGGRTVQNVRTLESRRYRIELDGPLGPTDTVTLSGAVDLAGNPAVGPIVVDPAE